MNFIRSPSLHIDAIRNISEALIRNENDTSMLYLRAILSKTLYDDFFSHENNLRRYFFDAEKISNYSKLRRVRGDVSLGQKRGLKEFLLYSTVDFKNPLRTKFNSESIIDENGFLLIDSILTVVYHGETEILNVENFKFTHEDDYIKACYLGHPTACNYLNSSIDSSNYDKILKYHLPLEILIKR